MSTELKPCPFCGGEALFGRDSDGAQGVGCKDCGAGTRAFYPLKEDCHELAASAWNRRPSADAGAAELARLRSIIDRTYKQWVGRDFLHLELPEAIGAAIQAREDAGAAGVPQDHEAWLRSVASEACMFTSKAIVVLLEDALAAASPTAPALPKEWISVEERMPEPETECLVYGKSAWAKEPYVRIDTWAMQREAPLSFSSATIETGYGWDDADFDDITHWMPLPTAPALQKQQDDQAQAADSEGGEVA